MSRIAKKPIPVPEKTEVTVSGGTVTVKGPAGSLSREFPETIVIALNDKKEVTITPTADTLEIRALRGTVAAHIKNMLKGVNTPFQKKLVIEGIGFKSEVKGDELTMSLGFSHQVKVKIPKELKVTAEKNVLTISGVDTEAVGQFAAKVRDLKKPEPYKGKGIHYEGEVIRRKQGKKTT